MVFITGITMVYGDYNAGWAVKTALHSGYDPFIHGYIIAMDIHIISYYVLNYVI